MIKYISILLLQCLAVLAYSQSLPAYRIFSSTGRPVTFNKMVKQLERKDMILFGEIHDNPIDHWLQIELVKVLLEKRKLILGAEMFETDNQTMLDDYLQDKIQDIRKAPNIRLWGNYDTDYAPLLEFAKKHRLPFIATNVPAEFAKMVYRSGFEALTLLTPDQLSYVAPQPMPFDPELKTYKDILKMMEHHATPELVMAQALRDATMAHFIYKNYREGELFIHLNGTYHTEYYEGILWYLKKYNEYLGYATIATAQQPSLKKLLPENRGKADFIICVDEDMTSTH